MVKEMLNIGISFIKTRSYLVILSPAKIRSFNRDDRQEPVNPHFALLTFWANTLRVGWYITHRKKQTHTFNNARLHQKRYTSLLDLYSDESYPIGILK
jgi:hypothetical protein